MSSTALTPFKGYGFGGGGSSPHNQEDNMFSTDVVEVLLGITEGPIKGLENGAKSFTVGDTPLRSETGLNNLGLFELTHLRGSELGEDIYSKLGGFGSSTDVGVNLAPSVDVIRQGSHTNIDYLDVRIVINQLGLQKKKGSYEGTGKFRIQYKKSASATWQDLRTLRNTDAPDEEEKSSNKTISRGYKKDRLVSGAPGDRMAFWQSAVPATLDDDAIWFDSDEDNRPKRISGGTWVNIFNATKVGDNWKWTEKSTWGNDNEYVTYISDTKPAVAKQGDFWLRTAHDEENIGIVYVYNGVSWNIAAGSLSPGGFGTGGQTSILDGGVVQVEGRISSPEVKEFRIPVDNYGGTYDIKVTRITEANTDKKFFDVTWESFQEVTGKSFNFPGLATTQLVLPASDKFSSVADMAGIYEGRIVKVPSNYDPETRVYTGVWDGTWKPAYTNNPAYVGYDLVNNDRYGMKAYYDVTLDPMDVYAAGQHCDKICADGQPRFTCNALISDPLGGRDALNYIFGIFGGRFFDDGNGKATLKIDGDNEPASLMFGPENVEDGLFIYSFTDVMSRPNDYTVSFTNPDLDWETDRRRVFDQSHINQYQRIPQNFEAVGCTDWREAKRRARYRLVTGLTEVRSVSFKTNRMGLYASPYEICLIADPDLDEGLSGRAKSLITQRKIELRDPLYLEPGFDYTLVYQYLNEVGFEIRKVNIVNGTSGSIMEVPLVDDLPNDMPELFHFSIERRDGSKAAKPYRIMSISEVENNPDKIEIQAIEVNRNKWLYIDGFIDDVDDVEVNDNVKGLPKPPKELRIKAEWHKTGGSYLYSVYLDWDRSPTKTAFRYNIYMSRNNGPFVYIGRTGARRYEINHLKQGEYQFQVRAVNHRRMEGEGRFIEHRLVGQLSEYNTVENLRLVDGVSEFIYESRSPLLAWDEVESGRHEKYVIQILNPNTDEVMATYKQKPRRFRYAYDDNREDHGGEPARRYKVRLYSQDDDEEWGDPTDIIINNPAPPVPSNLSVEDTAAGAFITFDQPTKRDYEGIVVYAATSGANFTPSQVNMKYKGPSNNIRLKLDKYQTWYIKIAAYDGFGTADLNYSSAFAINTNVGVDPNDLPEGAVTGKGTMAVRNKSYVSLSGNKNWSGNTTKTKYTETVILDTFTAKTNSKSPIQIEGKMTLINRNSGVALRGQGQNVVECELTLEYQRPGGSTWTAINRIKTKMLGSKDPIDSVFTKQDMSKNHQIKDTGLHKYRLKLKVYHKKAYTNGLTSVDVNVHGGLTFVWLKK